MCFFKQNKATAAELEKYYDAINRVPDYQPNYYENGYDFKPSPVLTVERSKELLPVTWGLIPQSVKTVDSARKIRLNTLNCKSEMMYETPAFKDSAKAGLRGLTGCTGFFEWHHSAGGKNKTPYKVEAKDHGIFSLGVIYSHWYDPAIGEEILTYAVLTTDSNPMMSWLHNSKKRQPVIIPRAYERDWLNPNLTEKDVLELCRAMPEDFLTYYSIGKQIGGNKLTSDEKNSPEIEKPVEYSPEEIEGEKEAKAPKSAKAKKGKPDSGQGSLF
jgi:putative SOS response-associated peptidase YedK